MKEVKSWLDVAKSLCEDLNKDVNDVAKRLKKWGKDHNFSKDFIFYH